MQVGCVLEPLPLSFTATAVRVTVITLGNHLELISFLVIPASKTPVVLGSPWLHRHNPQIEWLQRNVASWSLHCQAHCLKLALTPGGSSAALWSPSALAILSRVPEQFRNPQPW